MIRVININDNFMNFNYQYLIYGKSEVLPSFFKIYLIKLYFKFVNQSLPLTCPVQS